LRALVIISGIAAGAAIAWVLNKSLPRKIKNKNQRLGLQISAYIVFILLGLAFASIFSLQIVLDKFIDSRIAAMETGLDRRFPDKNILETRFGTGELVSINEQIQQTVKEIDTKSDGFFERLVFNALIGRLFTYINAVDSGATALSNMSDEDGTVTIKTLLYNLKTTALKAAEPYFTAFQVAIVILALVSFAIYAAIVICVRSEERAGARNARVGK